MLAVDVLRGCYFLLAGILFIFLLEIVLQLTGSKMQRRVMSEFKRGSAILRLYQAWYPFFQGFIKLVIMLGLCDVVFDYLSLTYGRSFVIKVLVGFVFFALLIALAFDVYFDVMVFRKKRSFKNVKAFFIVEKILVFVWIALSTNSVIYMFPVFIATFWKH